MQAGLVSQRLALRDIFTAGGLTRRIFVAVVHVSVTVQPTESDEAELSTPLLAVGSETGCLINSERCKHRASVAVRTCPLSYPPRRPLGRCALPSSGRSVPCRA